MSAPLQTSPPSPSQTDAASDQVTNPHWSHRWRRWRPVVITLALMLIPVLITLWTRPITSKAPLAIDNPKDSGTMAVAELLRHEGISVSKAGNVSEAVKASGSGTTIAVVNADRLSQEDRQALAQAGGDVVVIGARGGSDALAGLTDMTSKGTAASGSNNLEPQCADTDAQAAQGLAGTRASVSLHSDADAIGCFPVDEDRYAYATDTLPSGATLRVLPDPAPVTNKHLAQEGNAALSVRALGHHDRLLWLDGSRVETATVWNSPSTPAWLPVLILQLLVMAGVLAIVQGRRFGRIMSEELPVVVRSTETTQARGRLYRQGSDRPRAAEALRSGTALRLGAALGLPPGSSRRDVVAAIAQASGIDPATVDSLLYGPPPTSDRALAALAVQLDQLESEVHSA
ncbi:DUF4350 domain-containing protein [Actinomyces sp. ZJ308]|uniref:DUF4350 domain-containing protein n=1 Tax=Actinomyces sp. ZJ308 TaxID=2708342 RepID=UPI00141F52D6|nr:DUF4350 domain-containing protein [Actinomyces sp. ZJ308]